MYQYVCRPCEVSFETFQKMSEDPIKECPFCCKPVLEKLYSVPHISVPDNPKTLGQLAEYNTKKMSEEDRNLQTQMKKEKRKRGIRKIEQETGGKIIEASKEVPWWRSGQNGTTYSDKPVDTTKITNIKRFVETGKT